MNHTENKKLLLKWIFGNKIYLQEEQSNLFWIIVALLF